VAPPAGMAPGPLSVGRALGPPLAIALAARGIHLLHASAVRTTRGVVAFCAESGEGKSTLAAAAAHHPDLGLARVADDQLPVRLGERPEALPHFPQLKLPVAEWYRAAEPPVLPLVALVGLSPPPPVAAGDAAPRAELTRLEPAAVALMLARATVAARLFDADLLAEHFDACGRTAAGGLAGYRLCYPRRFDHLRSALALIAHL
jgi:hypothetical protein